MTATKDSITPGEWFKTDIETVRASDGAVARCDIPGRPIAECEANATAVRALPDLLAACEAMAAADDFDDGSDDLAVLG